MFKKILIANRGEIAARIIRTCKRLEIQTVALFSEADKNSPYVKLADSAFFIGSAIATESYLDIEKIIAIAKRANVCAVHPGYGFLSENTDFAKRLELEKINFIGAPSKSIDMMGSKSKAKQLMESAEVPVVPGFHGHEQSPQQLLAEAIKIGFPVLLKAARGGGGKGMRIIQHEKDFLLGLESAKREALKSFSDDTMLIEKYLPSPRHIEVQVFADNHNNVVHLFERDCSIQRRHQKIVEEAPGINLPDRLRKNLYLAAINATRAVGYRGAGTIEFLVDGENFYFMEMNTRLQVEHPVTEMITGLDLVEWQILVSSGETLPLRQEAIKATGHAIEVRLYAEDCDKDFLPQTGSVRECHWPNESSTVRIDTGIEPGSDISIYYDPMIAKLICYSNTRTKTIGKLANALRDTHITGVKHNVAFLKAIIDNPHFINGELSTNFLKSFNIEVQQNSTQACLFAAVASAVPQSHANPWKSNNGWRLNLQPTLSKRFNYDGEVFHINIEPVSSNSFKIKINNQDFVVEDVSICGARVSLTLEDERQNARVYVNGVGIDVFTADGHTMLSKHQPNYDLCEDKKGQLTAPMPGSVVSILCKEQEAIEKGQTLMIIEAMKMEHNIIAPKSGTISKINFDIGHQVREGDELLALKSST